MSGRVSRIESSRFAKLLFRFRYEPLVQQLLPAIDVVLGVGTGRGFTESLFRGLIQVERQLLECVLLIALPDALQCIPAGGCGSRAGAAGGVATEGREQRLGLAVVGAKSQGLAQLAGRAGQVSRPI